MRILNILTVIIYIISVFLLIIMMFLIASLYLIPRTKKYFETVNEIIESNSYENDEMLFNSVKIGDKKLHRFLYRIIKRIFDIIMSLSGILIFLPTMLCFLILLGKGKKNVPIICKKRDIGYRGKQIYKYSFRQLNEENSLIGRLISSLEVENCLNYFNVLKGDISLVGLSPLYWSADKNRLKLCNYEKTGMVCLAQICRVQNLHEVYKFDLFYLNNQSFLLDLRIILGCVILTLSK